MTTETEQALAILFRRFKEESVSRSELVKAMSLELDWTKPSQAENLVDRGLNGGYIRETDEGELVATFDPTEIDVPFGFSPADKLFEPVERPETDSADAQTAEQGQAAGDAGGQPSAPGEASGLLEELLTRIADTAEGDRKRAVAAANAKQEALGGLITFETAALLVAHAKDLNVQDEAKTLLASLGEDAGQAGS